MAPSTAVKALITNADLVRSDMKLLLDVEPPP
jgi:hypothetical protein